MAKRSNRYQQSSSQGGIGKLGWLNVFLLACFLPLAILMVITIYSYNFLNFRNFNLIVTIGLAVIFLFSLFFILKKGMKVLTTLILLLSLIGLGGGLYFLRSAVDLSNKLNQSASFSEVEMSVVVHKDSPITDISEVTSVLAPTSKDQTNIQDLINAIQKEKGNSPSLEEVDSYQAAYQALLADTSKVMVMNGAYDSLLKLEDETYASNLKVIYTHKIEKTTESTSQPVDGDVFNIYISGIDTYGPITSVSRSDVNIIMTVNQKTKKILLTTTPRDSYVAIADGGNNQYDKLTHAGIYGVDASIHTLENLYGIDINHYARINFTSFITLVDLLGGVEVYNDQAFVSHIGGFDFPVGNLTLNSERALAFVRERYSLSGGDNDRGKNQTKVIAAIIDKLTSVQALTKYTDIINGLGNSVQTDMTLESMMALANSQLESGQSYTVTSQALTGTGSTGQLPSYAMPGSALYMLSIDDASLAAVKQAITDTMEGK